MIPYVIGFVVFLVLFGALKQTEQPTRLRGRIAESAINTFTALEISVPRILSTKELYDADRIVLTSVLPTRTTTGTAIARAQLMLSDDEPTALLNADDPKLLATLEIETAMVLIESAAGVFTVQKIAPSSTIRKGVVDSTRWRNLIPDDKVWLCVHSVAVTNVVTADVVILGKLDKVSSDDFNALVISRL